MHCKCHKCLDRRQSCTGVSLSGRRWIELCWGNTSPLDIRWHLLECTCRHGNSQSDAKHSSFLSCLLVVTDTNQSSVQTRTHTQRQNHNVRWKVGIFQYGKTCNLMLLVQALAEGGVVGAWALAPFPLDAQSALLSRQLLLLFFLIKRPFVKACPI